MASRPPSPFPINSLVLVLLLNSPISLIRISDQPYPPFPSRTNPTTPKPQKPRLSQPPHNDRVTAPPHSWHTASCTRELHAATSHSSQPCTALVASHCMNRPSYGNSVMWCHNVQPLHLYTLHLAATWFSAQLQPFIPVELLFCISHHQPCTVRVPEVRCRVL